MAITDISRDWGISPSIVRVVTTDDLATITEDGYLTAQANNIKAIQNGTFEWLDTDMVAISYAGGKGFFTVDMTDMTFASLSPMAGHLAVTLSPAEVIAAYATPPLIVPAGGAHTVVVPTTIFVEFDYATTQYTLGGAAGLQYGSAAHKAGTAASSTIAGATIDGYTANNGILLTPAATALMAGMVNLGLYWSNDTAAFATGDSPITLNVSYITLPTTA